MPSFFRSLLIQTLIGVFALLSFAIAPASAKAYDDDDDKKPTTSQEKPKAEKTKAEPEDKEKKPEHADKPAPGEKTSEDKSEPKNKVQEPVKNAEDEDKTEVADQDDDDDEDTKEAEDGDEEPVKKVQKIADTVKGDTVFEGLFTLYQNKKRGSLTMVIKKDQLDKAFILTSQTINGVVEAGHMKGFYRGQKVFKIRRHYGRLEFEIINPHFYFDPEHPLYRAKQSNISPAIVAVSRIVKEDDETGDMLISADGLFFSEALHKISPQLSPHKGPIRKPQFRLGKLSRGKTKFTHINNYPENSSLTVDYVFDNPSAVVPGGAEITDPRAVTLSVQHTLLQMPDNDYKPRFDDARVGLFSSYVNDMTAMSDTPWRDMINRWNLVKKFPDEKLSEPIKKITWWIENTTPLEHRDTIKKAILSWNKALEIAGFKDVIEVKIQSDDAEWDAGDIRYNVVRWASSPQPMFSGYGPHVVNPLTGEILAADIMLEYSFLTNGLRQAALFNTNAYSATALMDYSGTNPYIETQSLTGNSNFGQFENEQQCSIGQFLQQNTMLGKTLSSVFSSSKAENAELIRQSVYFLVVHEIGHTLGLTHNMKSSQSLPYAEAHQTPKTGQALLGSVMDYPAVNFSSDSKNQGPYYTTQPGDYDRWALQFAYDPAMDNAETRAKHLARSTEAKLAFGNDADDMRAPGKGIDPRINIGDFTDDAVSYAVERLKTDEAAMTRLLEHFTASGESYQSLRNAYLVLTADMAMQGNIASRYIGGIYIDRAIAGQTNATAPYKPAPEQTQRAAMKLLADHIFAPEAFAASPKLLGHLAIQRRGFLHMMATEDPHLHKRIYDIQASIVAHILHPATLVRISDSMLYGNTYSISEVFADLTDALFEKDLRGKVNGYRQNIQLHYVQTLLNMLNDSRYDFVARSNAMMALKNIRKWMKRAQYGEIGTRAHREHIEFLIARTLDVATH